jgi:hypothetical protein
MRFAIRVGALALTLALAVTAVAAATTYRGDADGDSRMAVKLKVRAGTVLFNYSNVLTRCSNGDHVRYPGARHSTVLRRTDRFKDTITDGQQTSVVRGRVGSRRASGTIRYELSYDGGECHSGRVDWRARVR